MKTTTTTPTNKLSEYPRAERQTNTPGQLWIMQVPVINTSHFKQEDADALYESRDRLGNRR